MTESFQAQVQRVRDEKTLAWKRNGGNDPKDKDMSKEKKAATDEKEDTPAVNFEEVELTRQQQLQIESESLRKVERERAVQGGGVKLLREKVPFIW